MSQIECRLRFEGRERQDGVELEGGRSFLHTTINLIMFLQVYRNLALENILFKCTFSYHSRLKGLTRTLEHNIGKLIMSFVNLELPVFSLSLYLFIIFLAVYRTYLQPEPNPFLQIYVF